MMMLPTFAISQSTTANNNQNFFGTKYLGFQNNWGLSVRTDGITRMRFNPSGSDFQGVGTGGYIGIGDDPADIRSRLTITGTNNTFFGGAGYRSWMKTGVFSLENSDNLYVGLKEEGFNRSDAIFAWGDDGGGNALNNARFIFAGTAPVDGSCTNCPTNPSGLNGREVLRMNPDGKIGVGPLFVQNNQPKSTMHMHIENNNSNWLQISNQNLGLTPNSVTQSDGLRIGIFGSANGNANGNAMIYNQENRHLLFSTGSGTGITTPTNTRERMRITAVANPTELPNGSIGNYNPGNINGNRTRVAISHDPANPVTRPLSLLHLGYNTGSAFFPATTDGWRSWMDVGMFVAQGTDNMYFGLKPEGSDRFDAVINWGDNQDALGQFPIGPDNLRFVFTSTTAIGSGDPVSTTEDGLEMGRFEPTEDQNGLVDSYGKLGVGDFYTTPLPVTHKLHVRGNGRFEYIPEATAEHIILGKEIDASNPDDVSFRRLAFTNDPNDVLLGDGTWGTVTGVGGVQGAHNGTAMSTNNTDFVAFGQDVGQAGDPGILLSDREVPMDDFNIYFEGQGVPGTNTVNVGALPGFVPPTPGEGKFNVHQNAGVPVGVNSKAGIFLNEDRGGVPESAFTGVYGEASGLQDPALGIYNVGGEFRARQASGNIAVRGIVEIDPSVAYSTTSLSSSNVGGEFRVFGDGFENLGIRTTATGGEIAYGIRAVASANTGGTSYGIYAAAVPNNPGTHYAGYFDGDVLFNGDVIDSQFGWVASDAQFKTQINNLQNAMDIIESLSPKTFYMDTTNSHDISFSSELQYGMVAQDVESILPNLVGESTLPAKYDSLGNVVTPEVNYKTLKYDAFIPILTKGMQEQNSKIDSLQNELASKDSLLDDVNDRLTQLEDCLSNLLPVLCQINNSAIQENDDQTQSELLHQINVELFDGENIILEQNIPNPFAERTVINYKIPASVGNAKLMFYNNTGRMIREVKISERGEGQVNVYGAELSKGTYSYTLICDGEVVATKKMVKQ